MCNFTNKNLYLPKHIIKLYNSIVNAVDNYGEYAIIDVKQVTSNKHQATSLCGNSSYIIIKLVKSDLIN